MPFIRVRDRTVMSVITMQVDDSIKMAADLMIANSIGSVIIKQGDKPVGIITERDLLRYAYNTEFSDYSVPIRNIMSSPLETINANERITKAAQMMIIKGFRRLGVVNDEGELIGICSISDLLHDMSNAKLLLTETIQETEEKGLRKIAFRISHELDTLLENVYTRDYSKTEQEEESYFQLHELLTRLNTKQDQRFTIHHEKSLFVMISTESGTSIYSKDLDFEKDFPANDQLMSALFFALNNFMKEIVLEDGFIDRIKFKDYTITIMKIGKYLLSYVFKGESYLGIKRMERLAGKIKDNPRLVEYLEKDHFKVSWWVIESLDECVDNVYRNPLNLTL
ncbi:MAG: CBS domain-containing protein [Candidatus Heimdallarchaeota archaeon]|nr:CBS domain-containing protein [Candidatus Heimdallarchaeota archaeon]